MSSPPTAASPLEALKAGFRRACVRRLVGDENGAIEVLKNEIPLLVVGWAKSTSLEPAEKKAKLKEMFDDESARADELATAFDLFAGRFETRVAEMVRKELKKTAAGLEKLARELAKAPRAKPDEPKVDAQTEMELPEPEPALEPEPEEPESEEPVEEEAFEEEEVEHLDPPKGIGLRFDEIEQMIDEVLSGES
jgi:hypothetical protein